MKVVTANLDIDIFCLFCSIIIKKYLQTYSKIKIIIHLSSTYDSHLLIFDIKQQIVKKIWE